MFSHLCAANNIDVLVASCKSLIFFFSYAILKVCIYATIGQPLAFVLTFLDKAIIHKSPIVYVIVFDVNLPFCSIPFKGSFSLSGFITRDGPLQMHKGQS